MELGHTVFDDDGVEYSAAVLVQIVAELDRERGKNP
jgi:hypothetical protein